MSILVGSIIVYKINTRYIQSKHIFPKKLSKRNIKERRRLKYMPQKVL